MDLALTETELLLAESVRSFVGRAADRESMLALPQGANPTLSQWHATMRDAGWLGLLIPADDGGEGATCTEAAVMSTELGRAPVPVAWVLSSGVVASVLRAADPSATRSHALEAIAKGDMLVVPALRQEGRSWQGLNPLTHALAGRGAQQTLHAELVFVVGAGQATHVLVPLDTDDGYVLALVDLAHPGVQSRRLEGLLHESYAVTLHQLPLADVTCVPCSSGPDQLGEGLALGMAMLASFQVGGCATVLEMSVSYANDRRQFGRAIGEFQRVQDHVVRIVNALDTARWVTFDAIAAADNGRPFAGQAWLGRALASEGYWEATNAAHEVHAGIGSDPAFGLILHTSMARTLYDSVGNPTWCRAQFERAQGWSA